MIIITQNEVNAVFDEQVGSVPTRYNGKQENTPETIRIGWELLRLLLRYSTALTHGTKRSQTALTICSY